MPLTENGAIKKVARSFVQLATPGSSKQQAFLSAVRKELKPEVRKMYATSSDPFGSAWTRNKDGSPAYDSKKMANAIGVARIPNGLAVREWVKWIKAADEGHTFPARTVASKAVYFNTINQFMKKRTVERAANNARVVRVETRRGTLLVREYKSKSTILAREVIGKAHTVGPRVLPARPQQPNGVMPDAWGQAINRGAENGIREFGERSFDDG